MKIYLNQALIFSIYGLACGVYYREYTKMNGFTERTMLGMAHPHILCLGLCGFLLIALFVKVLKIEDSPKLKFANGIYMVGLIVASAMMLVRGTMEVSGAEISSTTSAVISGIAGLGHIAVAVGLVTFVAAFKKAA